MTQANESLDLTASQHIERIYEHTGGAIFDYALVNTAPVSEQLRISMQVRVPRRLRLTSPALRPWAFA